MISIISFDQYQTNCRKELLEEFKDDPDPTVISDCDNCNGGGVCTCSECDQDRDCPDCENGKIEVHPSEFIPTRAEYYRQVFSDVVNYSRAMPGDFLDNISNAISELNRAFGYNWRSNIQSGDSWKNFSRSLERRI